MHLGICIPGESMPMESVRSYCRMFLDLLANPIPGLQAVSQHICAGSILPWVRARVVGEANKLGATHFLLLDSDMTYPPDMARRLLAHGRPFVAANAVTRREPIRWAAADKAGNPMPSHERRGLERAGHVGLAVALIEKRVFEAIPSPLFEFGYTDAGWNGEDVTFCRKAIGAGFAPMVDHDLSREIGHVGTRVYTGADLTPEG